MFFHYLPQIMIVAFIHLLFAISPGPDFAIVTRNTLQYSRKIGIHTAFGIASGILIHTVYAIAGIAFLIAQSPVVFSLIKYAGAGYVAYIGYCSIRAGFGNIGNTNMGEKKHETISVLKSVRMGVLTNAMNPKAILYMLSIFTLVIDHKTPLLVKAVFGVEMIAIQFLWFAALAVLLSHSWVKKRVSRWQSHVEKAMGIALLILALNIIFTK
jgi:RhtB (resistance to homoserine/threonine) family protein